MATTTTTSSSSNEPLLKKKKKQCLGWIEWLRGWFSLFYEFLFQRITASHLHNPMPLPPINDLTCIVTGSTSGIGLEIARYCYPFVFSDQFLVFDWLLIVGFCFWLKKIDFCNLGLWHWYWNCKVPFCFFLINFLFLIGYELWGFVFDWKKLIFVTLVGCCCLIRVKWVFLESG